MIERSRRRLDALAARLRPPPRVRLAARIGFIVVAILFVLTPYRLGGSYFADLWTDMALWATIGLGLNVVIGFAGLLDLGYMAFYAIGGYVFANAALYHGMTIWETLPIGAAIAAIASALIGFPTLRVRGDYLAIMTLGFGGIVYYAAQNLNTITGGVNGLFGWHTQSIAGHQFANAIDFYPLTLAIAFCAALVTMALRGSRMGRAWVCIKDDEVAAATAGIPVIRYKLYAYMVGAVWAGFAGAIFALKQGIVSPESFNFDASFFAVTVVILGGMGSIPGVMIGGVFYVVIAEWLAAYTGTLSGVIFAALLLLMVLLRPQGLIPYRPRPPAWMLRMLESQPGPGPVATDDYRLSG
ncbi:MAG: branched-chain amino acid ABC transporter permease [Candidatus Dormibacteria bacterium]